MNTENLMLTEMYQVIEHGICVSQLSYHIGKELRLDEPLCYELAVAGVIHDIGKLRLNRYIYDKRESLTKEEMGFVRMHATLSYEMLKDKGYSDFILETILYHHENYDGSGYPKNLVGEEIPLGARIMRISDVYSALISDRPYRKRFDKNTAIRIMIDEVKNYDLRIFMAFQQVIHEMDFVGEEKLLEA